MASVLCSKPPSTCLSEYLPVRVLACHCVRSTVCGPFPPVLRDPHRMPTGLCLRTPAPSPQFAIRAVVADHRLASNADLDQPCGRSHQGSLHSRQDLRRRRPPVWGYVQADCGVERNRVPRRQKPRHVQMAAARCSSQPPLGERREKAKHQSISRSTSAGLALLQIVALTHTILSNLGQDTRVPCRIAKYQTIKIRADRRSSSAFPQSVYVPNIGRTLG